ncbi:MAG: NADH-quinone oxidoreductase subunit N [Flavobacteriia bacterium]|nr:NADH-quinone oxidoreductase subunit N [Flavobacteriia bacterium]
MDAVVVIFVTGLISLFLGMYHKPMLALTSNLLGLSTAFTLFFLYGTYNSVLKSHFFSLVYDGTGVLLSLLSILMTAMVLIMGYTSQAQDRNSYADLTSLMMFSLTGALCLIGFRDFFMFFIGLEILSIPVYVLVGSRRGNRASAEAALKYFFTGSFATAILLFGIALVFGATGSFNINEIGFAILSGLYTPELMIPGALMILAALLFKVGAFPFHFWTADVYEGSSKPVLAFMSTTVKIAGLFAMVQLMGTIFGNLKGNWEVILYVVIIVTLFLGYLSAIQQKSLKRLLAYSGISNTGIALLSILNGADHGSRNIVIFLLAYGASALILLVVAQFAQDEEKDIEELKGIGYRSPVLGVALLIALLSLSGIPPFSGFFGKLLLIQDVLVDHPVLSICAVLSSVIGAYVYIKLLLHFFDKESTLKDVRINVASIIVISVASLLLIGGWFILYI